MTNPATVPDVKRRGSASIDVGRPLEPLWRGLIVYRLLTFTTHVIAVLAALGEYRSSTGAIAVLAVIAAWTAATTVFYSSPGARPGRDRRRVVAVLDVLVSAAVMATTRYVETTQQIDADAPVMGSVWASAPVLALAIAFGPIGGFVGAGVISGMLIAVKRQVGAVELSDIQLLILAGLTVGYAAWVMQRYAERLRVAVAAQGAAAERERLARSIHDGVLQVLSHVRRRGAELGGPAAEFGELAGEQEVALRTLITSGAPVAADGQLDLLAEIAGLASQRITVSLPGTPVELPAHAVDTLLAVAKAALSNVDHHVGRDAPAWILVEDLGDAVEVSVRDDGPGIPAGRLDAAAAEGRMGVARSMQGRITDLGGTISCTTGPDIGTEWTIRLPRTAVTPAAKGRRR